MTPQTRGKTIWQRSWRRQHRLQLPGDLPAPFYHNILPIYPGNVTRELPLWDSGAMPPRRTSAHAVTGGSGARAMLKQERKCVISVVASSRSRYKNQRIAQCYSRPDGSPGSPSPSSPTKSPGRIPHLCTLSFQCDKAAQHANKYDWVKQPV